MVPRNLGRAVGSAAAAYGIYQGDAYAAIKINEAAVHSEIDSAARAGTQLSGERIREIMDKKGIVRELVNAVLNPPAPPPEPPRNVEGSMEAGKLKITGSYKTGASPSPGDPSE